MSASGRSIREISNTLGISFEVVRTWINVGRRPQPIKTVENLKNMGLIPIEKFDSMNKKQQLVAKLHAFVYGDGTLYKSQIALYGQKEDLRELERELHCIFPRIRAYCYKAESRYSFQNGIGYGLMIYSAELARCLAGLGAPVGNKTNQDVEIPTWLFNAPNEISKLWLEVFLGNEGTALSGYGRDKYVPIHICLSKRKDLEKNLVEFLEGLRTLLSRFGIQTSPMRRKNQVIRKGDGAKVCRYYFNVGGNIFNLVKFYETFKFEYARAKRRKIEQNLKGAKERHGSYLARIHAYLIAKRLRQIGLHYNQVKEIYEKSNQLSSSVTWNTFYNYFRNSGSTPRYLETAGSYTTL